MNRLKVNSYKLYKKLEVSDPLKRSLKLTADNTDAFINNVNVLIEKEL